MLGSLAGITFLLVLAFPEYEAILFLVFTVVGVPAIGIISALVSRRSLNS